MLQCSSRIAGITTAIDAMHRHPRLAMLYFSAWVVFGAVLLLLSQPTSRNINPYPHPHLPACTRDLVAPASFLASTTQQLRHDELTLIFVVLLRYQSLDQGYIQLW
jgi:hypothetical protein